MKYKIVFVPFAFADIAFNKPRPALCLAEPMGRFGEVIVAFFTSQTPPDPQASDLLIDPFSSTGIGTGLKKISTLCLHKITTVNESAVNFEIGELPFALQTGVETRLRALFDL